MKPLHSLSRCEFIECGKHETPSKVLRFAIYANWHGSLGRVVMESISFNVRDSKTLRGTGLHAIGLIFRQAVVDDFFGRSVILVVR